MLMMKKLILLAYFFRVCLCGDAASDLEDIGYLAEVKEEAVVSSKDRDSALNATLFRSVKSYYCSAPTEEEQDLLLFGSKAWTFPPQDVKLVLRYPSEYKEMKQKEVEGQNYTHILTGLKVVFHLSGPDGKGFITRGGMNQDHISMKFEFRNLSSLAYSFHLYGVPRIMIENSDFYASKLDLC